MYYPVSVWGDILTEVRKDPKILKSHKDKAKSIINRIRQYEKRKTPNPKQARKLETEANKLFNLFIARQRRLDNRSKNPVKKKRTAKQIAATKKLVALNKKRHGKKRASKKTRKRNPTPKHKNWVVATWSPTGKCAVYHDGVSWSKLKSSAAVWHKQSKAQNFAKRCGRKCVVADITTRPSAIKAVITGKV